MNYSALLFIVSMLLSANLDAQAWFPANGHYGWKKQCGLCTVNGKVLIGCDSGKVLVTGDDGFTWKVFSAPTTRTVRSLSQLPNGEIVAGVYYGGLFLSNDDGETWSPMNAPDTVINQVCALPNGDIYITLSFFQNYAYKSSDLGLTWDTVQTGRVYAPEVITYCENTGEIFMGSNLGLFVSPDTGNTWIFADSTTGLICVDRFMNTDTLFGTTWTGLYRSYDNGATWSNAGLGNSYIRWVDCTVDGKVFYQSSNMGQYGFSIDSCATWNIEYFPGTFKGFCYNSATRRLFVANDLQEGIPRYTFDGTTTVATHYDFYYSGNGIYATSSNETFCSPFDTVMFAGGFSNTNAQLIGGFYRSTDNGKNWNYITGTSSRFPTCFLRVSDSVLLMGVTNNGPLHSGIFRSTDNGLTWINCGLSGSSVHEMLRTSTGKILASTSTGNYHSFDNGLTWIIISASQTMFGQMFCNPINGMIAAKPAASATIHYSIDDGLTWTTGVSFPTSGSYLGMNPVTGTVFMTNQTGDFNRSTDGGITWSLIPLPGGVYSRRIFGTPCGELYISGTDNYLYLSTDDGLTWVQLSNSYIAGLFDVQLSGFNTLLCDIYFGPHAYQLNNTVTSCAYVWPGDANDDQYVNGTDLFSVALSNGQTGPQRASVSNNWTPFPSSSWSLQQFNGSDLKHADCNGDGNVDANDTMAVTLNYSNYHPARMGQALPVTSTFMAQLVSLSGDTIVGGSPAIFGLIINTSASGFVGCTYRVSATNQPIDSTLTTVTYFSLNGGSWLSIHPASDNEGIDGAICRNNNTDTSGSIMVSGVQFITDSSIISPQILQPSVQYCILLLSDSTLYQVTATTESIVVVPAGTAINEFESITLQVTPVPNPTRSNSNLIISGLSPGEEYELIVYTPDGKIVEQRNARASLGITTENVGFRRPLEQGNYFVIIRCSKGIKSCHLIVTGEE